MYSIGHSNRNVEEFIQLLKKYGIEEIIDVRRFPTSKIKEYKKENLKKICNENGIDYAHLENLGGFRVDMKNGCLARNGKMHLRS